MKNDDVVNRLSNSSHQRWKDLDGWSTILWLCPWH